MRASWDITPNVWGGGRGELLAMDQMGVAQPEQLEWSKAYS